ncbi:hypothetical protein J2X31_002919 [Flavobacterium arsenatis]|uniref:Uncharacterized protein n=1 Tax=Flavobacterium arsenatis TaxID=1484332 RepID=A0ABU1TSM6_9FLAO|nr:hypothetical protein [Flavobacterium arsenatis]MDR6968893.1 hypothetical protein [Flavobacterium arsenatis]
MNSFNEAEQNIYIGEVSYYNDEKPTYMTGNFFYSFLVKHNYYEFESEVRCIHQLPEGKNLPEDTHRIPVNLGTLIEEVYISPFASKTGFLKIIEYLRDQAGLDFKISVSGVNDRWI